MTAVLTVWLAYVAVSAALVWHARRAAVPLAVVAALMFPGSLAALGRGAPWTPPAGEYVVLGGKSERDVAIYLLLQGEEGEPRYYVMPYSEENASKYQEAKNEAEAEGGVVTFEIGDNGATGFGERVPAPEPDKTVESAIIGEVH